MGARRVIVTLGAAGALLAHDGTVTAFEAEAIDAVDVFCGVFAAGLGRGLDVTQAIRVAVRAATLSVTRPGTQRAFPSRSEIDLLFRTVEARG